MSRPSEAARPADCTAALRICLLGTPSVEWEDHPLDIPRCQARALLYRLAASQHTIPREHLCFLFWPDVPESTSRRNLTRLLTHLRRALPTAGLLTVAHDGIGLDSSRTWSDVAECARLCAALRESSQAAGTTGRLETLYKCVNLYRGPFLAGFSLPECREFEAWSAQERYAQEQPYLEALDELIQDRTTRGAYAEAIAYAQRYLASDELAEKVHRHLIELYAAAGNCGAALRQYERCVTVLERELGVSPLPETQAAYQVILHGRPLAEKPAPSHIWTIIPSLDAPLVGRDEALSQLESACARARLGHGGIMLVSGESGIGKSRLVQDSVRHLRDQATVMFGSCHEIERGLPYWPLIEALSPYVSDPGQAAFGAESHYMVQAARILHELRTSYPSSPPPAPVAPGQGDGYQRDAVVRLLSSLAARNPPLVLCLDDLHWADEATLSWLEHLSRRLKAAPILVIGTYRTEEAARLARLRTQAIRLGLLQEVKLEGLPQAKVLHLIRHLSGQMDAAERFSHRLHSETGGNPFFILETLRAMFEAGILWQDETGWSTDVDETTVDYRELPLPDTVCQAIRDRLSRLRPQVHQVLEAAAVIGHQFDLDLVRDASGRRESEVVDALDTLLARQVISEHDGVYQFMHDLIRTVVYRDLSHGRRRLLHRRAGEALVKRRSEDVTALARHFERAEDLHRAAEYALQAGQRARSVFAETTARVQCEKALTLLQRQAASLHHHDELAANWRLQIQALHERGWVLRLLGEMDAYARDSQEIARLAELLDDERTLAQARWREAHAHRWFCRYAEALAAAEDGVQRSRAVGDGLCEALCLREVGLAARALGEYGRARATLEQALDLFVQLGNAEYEIHVIGNLSTLYLYQGDYELALDLARRTLVRCDQAGLRFNRRLALGDMGAAAAAMGDTESAMQWFMESLAIAHQIADCTQEILCQGHLGWLYVKLGQPAPALERLSAALGQVEQVGSRTEQSWLHAGLAEAHRLAGDLGQAAAHARRALELAVAHGCAHDQELARQVLAGLEVAER